MKFGPYSVIDELGHGGMGVVHRARHADSGSEVALKVLDTPDAPEQLLRRFRREFEVSLRLEHPGIVRALECGETDGRLWFAMELVTGRPLSQLTTDRGWRESVELVRDVADALAYAHGAGVLHRDVKPSNILIDAAGRPLLADFGLAKSGDELSKLTQSGELLGTPAYMSPEQARGDLDSMTPASDVWSLGCVLHELLAGAPVFSGDTPAAVIGAVMQAAIAPLPRSAGLPRGLRTVVAGCLERNRDARYQSAEVVRDELDRVLAGQAPRRRPRRPALAWAAIAALVVVAGIVTVAATRPGAPAAPQPPHVDTRAEALAHTAWGLRSIDAPKGVTLLGEALAQVPGRHEWRLQRGLLRWVAEGDEAAIDEWSRVPADADEHPRAMLYTGLACLSRTFIEHGERKGRYGPQMRRAMEAVHSRDARSHRLAQAALAWLAGDEEGARTAVAGESGWDAALIRATLCDPTQPESAREAIASYDEALRDGLPIAFAYANRGGAHEALRNTQEALADFETALRMRPGWVLVLVNRAQLYQRRGEHANAFADLEEVMRLAPRWVPGIYSYALSLERAGRTREAIATYSRAVEIDETKVQAWNNRGRLRLLTGDTEGAFTDFSRALALDPTLRESRLNVAQIRSERGDLTGALREVDQLVRDHPRWPEAHYVRSVFLRQAQRPADSLAALDEAVRVAPEFIPARKNRMLQRSAAGQFAGAAEDAGELMRLEPAKASWAYQRGLYYGQLGRDADAIADYTETIRRDADFAQAYVNRALLFSKAGRIAEARADLAQAERAMPELPNTYAVRVGIDRKAGNWAAVIRDCDAFLRLQPNSKNAPWYRNMRAYAEQQAAKQR